MAKTSPLVFEVVGSNPGNPVGSNVAFSNSYVLSKFILEIADKGEGKHREETWSETDRVSECDFSEFIIRLCSIGVIATRRSSARIN